jgi:cbb3-type cytochrome oxidase cytochrome c subunit
MLIVALIAFACASAARAAGEAPAGVIAGWDSGNGRVLLGELGCTACHAAGPAANQLFHKQAPRLGDVGARIHVDYLRDFLTDPTKTKPGTPMPDVLHGLEAGRRTETIDVLVHFLVSQSGPMPAAGAAPDAKMLARGKLLYHTVGCVACHAPFDAPPRHKVDPSAPPPDDDEKPSPRAAYGAVPLGNLGVKTNVPALARFLAHPLHARPSGRMPSLSLTADEARAIAAYLLRDAGERKPAAFTVDADKAKRGKEAFASLGCASCHDTGSSREPERLDLALLNATATGVASKDNNSPPNESPKHAIDNNPKTKYLNFGKAGSGLVITIPGAPLVVTAVELTSANDSPGRDPASYLLEGSADGKTFDRIDARPVPEFPDRFSVQRFAFDNDRAYATYRLTFPKLRSEGDAMQIAEVALFAAPKPVVGIASTLKAEPLAKLNATAEAGCLGDKVASGRPRFALAAAQRAALRKSLGEVQKAPEAIKPAERVDLMMTALSCYACHSRGDKGGPDTKHAPYFAYEVVVDLGDEGRLPPALNEVGIKLTAVGFEEMLQSGRRYRTYMATRMPVFGRGNVSALPELFGQADAGKVPAHKPFAAPTLAADGRKIVGKNMLACINCHAWNEHRLPGAEGLDLARVPQRLQADWFHAFMLEPQKLKPRTRMPAAWPEGKSPFPKMQAGDTHKQIDGIWAYLSQGERGGAPAGLSLTQAHLLVPGDEPIVFRTFVDQVGALAILVGFRQRSHIAFDANRVRMVLAWSGDFISPDGAWEGRGGNYAKIPSKDIVKFPEGPPLAVLGSNTDAWPGDVPKPKGIGNHRTPEGWRYRGYRYDERRVPTFLYQAGPVAVEETPEPDDRAAGGAIVRRFHLSAEKDVERLFLRVAVGKQISEKDGVWTVDDAVKYRVSGPDVKPFVRTAGMTKELLVPVNIRPGADKSREAKVDIEVLWGS